MRRLASALAAGLAVALGACGGGDRQGVTVTEAEPTALPTRPPPSRFRSLPPDSAVRAPLDTIYADSALFADPALDSLRADSLETPAAPDFRRFWPRFRDALAAGADEAAALSTVDRARLRDLYPTLTTPPFAEGVRALTARDFRVVGPAREAVLTVGYDAAGAVVPEDEAVTEASLTLRFDVVDGAYRLVGLDRAG